MSSILDFIPDAKPAPAPRPQDICLNMLLAGKSTFEIAQALSMTEDQVNSIISSDWMHQQLEARIKSMPNAESILGNLLQVQTFRAIAKLGQLLQCGDPKTELGAAKEILHQYYIPRKVAAGINLQKEGVKSSEELERENQELKLKLKVVNA